MKRRWLFFLIAISACTTFRPVSYDIDAVNMDSGEGDARARTMIAPYKSVLEQEMGVVLCHNDVYLEKGKPESTLTNWFVDVVQNSTGRYFGHPADFTIQNYGGIRRGSIPMGEITVGMIYELMPFENQLVILHLSGETVGRICQTMSENGGWPVSYNMNFEIKEEKVQGIRINSMPLDKTHTYRVAMPDYVANGGDRLGLPEDALREEPGVLVRDALIEQLRDGGQIEGKKDGRIKIVGP